MNPVLSTLVHLFVIYVVAAPFVAIWASLLGAPNRRHPDEAIATALHSELLAGEFDSFRATWPLVRITIYPEFLLIAFAGGPILLRRSEVTGIKVEKTWMSGPRICILHAVRRISKRIRLYSWEPQKLEDALQMWLSRSEGGVNPGTERAA